MGNLGHVNIAVCINQSLKIGNCLLLEVLHLINIRGLNIRHCFRFAFDRDNILPCPAGRLDSDDQKDHNTNHCDSRSDKNRNRHFPQPAVLFPAFSITCQICYLFIILL